MKSELDDEKARRTFGGSTDRHWRSTQGLYPCGTHIAMQYDGAGQTILDVSIESTYTSMEDLGQDLADSESTGWLVWISFLFIVVIFLREFLLEFHAHSRVPIQRHHSNGCRSEASIGIRRSTYIVSDFCSHRDVDKSLYSLP